MKLIIMLVTRSLLVILWAWVHVANFVLTLSSLGTWTRKFFSSLWAGPKTLGYSAITASRTRRPLGPGRFICLQKNRPNVNGLVHEILAKLLHALEWIFLINSTRKRLWVGVSAKRCRDFVEFSCFCLRKTHGAFFENCWEVSWHDFEKNVFLKRRKKASILKINTFPLNLSISL